MSSDVNHPPHYNRGKIEVIDFIEDQGLGFCLGNAVKYICRAGHKDAAKKAEDLSKAAWYLTKELLKLAENERANLDDPSTICNPRGSK